MSPNLNSEVVATAKRRLIPNADKRRIVLAAAACVVADAGLTQLLTFD